ncbi:hypothetical protein PR048_018060 [Dryococelus australis]|uniref:Uncharacterized protein n=1 Tax=Dryococelus australis TaxID=614101 RepID=A0ABQ9HBD1_9NEOP|nr:hypothetical protein PR048_018060 [Dryococelus australis]
MGRGERLFMTTYWVNIIKTHGRSRARTTPCNQVIPRRGYKAPRHRHYDHPGATGYAPRRLSHPLIHKYHAHVTRGWVRGAVTARLPAELLPGFSCWMMTLVGGFPWGSPISPALAFRRCSILNTNLAPPLSALKTSLLRAAQTSPLSLYKYKAPDLPWRSRLARRRYGVREALGSNPGQGMGAYIRGSPRGDRDMRINSLIASTHKALNWRAVLPSRERERERERSRRTQRSDTEVADAEVGRLVYVDEVVGGGSVEARVLDLQPPSPVDSHLRRAVVLVLQVVACNNTHITKIEIMLTLTGAGFRNRQAELSVPGQPEDQRR